MVSYRNTIALVAALVVLFSLVYFYELRDTGSAKETPSQSVPLVRLSRAEVNRVEIKQGPQQLVLARAEAGAQWQIYTSASATGPGEEADQDRVDRLVTSLASLNASRVVTEQASDPTEYGLAEPAAEVVLQTASGQRQAVRFGSANPGANGRYAQLEGSQKVYLVYAYVVDDATRMIADPPRPKPTPTKAPALVTPTGTVSLPPPATVTPEQ